MNCFYIFLPVLVSLLLFLRVSLSLNTKTYPTYQNFQYKAEKNGKYAPNWESLDRRPLPQWYDKSKFGVFMHWGVYCVPSIHDESMWKAWRKYRNEEVQKFLNNNYKPGFSYAEFAPKFTAEFFDAKTFADVVKKSGAKYFVLTSKHHEGYTLWPSKYSWNWNSVDVGPHRDLVGELKDAILNVGDIHFGLYFSQYEWFNPLYLKDKENHFETQDYVKARSLPQMHEIINLYKPEILWSDGDWEAADSYWNSTEFLAWLYNDSPVKDTVVTNDRWGNGTRCHHGGFYSGPDRYEPGHLLPHKWENCMTIDVVSWGFRRTMTYKDVLGIEDLIERLAKTISCGGNFLMNVGPTHDGRIIPIFEERLTQMGQWLKINGEAVYDTKPWVYQHDTESPNVWYTSNLRKSDTLDQNRLYNQQSYANTVVFAFLLDWPKNEKLSLGAISPTSETKVTMLGYDGEIQFKPDEDAGGVSISLSGIPWKKLPTLWAWVFKFEYLKSSNRVPKFGEYNAKY